MCTARIPALRNTTSPPETDKEKSITSAVKQQLPSVGATSYETSYETSDTGYVNMEHPQQTMQSTSAAAEVLKYWGAQ